MASFVVGQRWISNTEPELGLGCVLEIDPRVVTMRFSAADETRRYVIGNAPLTRVQFGEGDSVESNDGWLLTIARVEEQCGLITYHGQSDSHDTEQTLHESNLSNTIQFSKPQERLFAGQIDSDSWFRLRYETLSHHADRSAAEIRGLCGARTALIEHQLYIAAEVANRYSPRVLLADEVGLGKTIEAGLILHHQLLTGRINRALIVVPESLCFQWLVEMLRRFNLSFSLFDEERCLSFATTDDNASAGNQETAENPFLSEQLVLCSLQFITAASSARQQQLLAGEWDLLIVDEAHHLYWSETAVSDEYRIIEQLAAQIGAVLLLTATPEQLGHASHFARLRLLDADRFHSLDHFIDEATNYAPVATAVATLLSDAPLTEHALNRQLSQLGEDHNQQLATILDTASTTQQRDEARQQLINELLDRHGTGRILFRNTRKTVAGFPQRQVTGYPLPLPQQYDTALEIYRNHLADEPLTATSVATSLHPESLYRDGFPQFKNRPWTSFDPRINWLAEQITQAPAKQKTLLICAHLQTALDIEQVLKNKLGIKTATFHQAMSIVQRDRAAAYFADIEEGAQILICSEIGSEGRNFQFAHHLILFDLPLNPDLLEQRIGRLDRIGQQSTIQIHAPYFEGSAQQLLFEWYHRGLDAFHHTCPAGHDTFEKVEKGLLAALISNTANTDEAEQLIEHTQQIHEQLNVLLQRGRDQLLELGSCRSSVADAIIDDIIRYEQPADLQQYMERLFDHFGVEFEEHSSKSYVIQANDQLLMTHFPHLPDSGATVTFDRHTALTREELMFLTWEHPMVSGAMDKIMSGEQGSATAVLVDSSEFDSDTNSSLLLEAIFMIECAAPKGLQLQRYLPPAILRVVVDEQAHLLNDAPSHDEINRAAMISETNANSSSVRQIIIDNRKKITRMVKSAEFSAQQQLPQLQHHATKLMLEKLSAEIKRLTLLKRVNPNIRAEEIDYLKDKTRTLHQHIQQAKIKLDAVRIILVP
ncbi:MAG: RNA polymerase-associated protein RapA [Gammaproteobacteria bacterium]|nr:RNA polymerase-associated protein RapA [Gammaproteobacteria bacterium]